MKQMPIPLKLEDMQCFRCIEKIFCDVLHRLLQAFLLALRSLIRRGAGGKLYLPFLHLNVLDYKALNSAYGMIRDVD